MAHVAADRVAGVAPRIRGQDLDQDHGIQGLAFDGNGRLEVVLPRQSGEILVGLEMRNERFVERWAIDFKSPVTSNLAAADIDGDGKTWWDKYWTMRKDYEAQEGENFSLKKFHDELLDHGMLPIRLLREVMLKNREKWAEVL